MRRRSVRVAGMLAAAALLTACETTKSSNPLSPAVAGPIPGVNITAPKTVDPVPEAKIAATAQPITLSVQNAATSGVRPLTYRFEIATDANFAAKVFSRDGVAPDASGKTTLRLTDKLAPERTYYWHVRAQDGANTGPYSAGSSFSVYTPVVLEAPVLVAPVHNVLLTDFRPKFTMTNARRSGPVGSISYMIELSDTTAFVKHLTWTVAEQPTQTVLPAPVDMYPGRLYYWHARAYDGKTIGPWSTTESFTAPTTPGGGGPTPTPTPQPPPPSGGGGPVAGDAINLSLAGVYAAPSDIASWPPTGKITRLQMSPTGSPVAGLSFQFTTSGSWPDYTPPGWTGAIQYTVWAVVNVGGRWYTSGFIQMWRSRASTGGPILTDFARNWAYDSRWGPMKGHQPVPGEQMGFFLSAGNARGETNVTSRRERTNVVLVRLPAGDSGVFTYSMPGIRMP